MTTPKKSCAELLTFEPLTSMTPNTTPDTPSLKPKGTSTVERLQSTVSVPRRRKDLSKSGVTYHEFTKSG